MEDSDIKPVTAEYSPAVANLEQLQAGRDAWAEKTADSRIRSIFAASAVEDRRYAVSSAPSNGVPYDDALGASTLFSLEALGIDARRILIETGADAGASNEVIASKTIGGDVLEIRRQGHGVSFIVNAEYPDSSGDPSAAIGVALQERIAQSPVQQAIIAARERYMPEFDDPIPDTVETEPFSYVEDPWATLTFLTDNGLVWSSEGIVSSVRSGMPPIEAIDTLLNTVKVARNELGNVTKLSWSDLGVRRELDIDKQNGTLVFRARRRPTDYWLERANQSGDTSLPFLETECAKKLSDTLDRTGLMFHPELQRMMMDTDHDSNRYGSIYTQLSREIAKWVNNPDRVRLSNLFVPFDPEFIGPKLVAREGETALRHYREKYAESADDVEAHVRAMYAGADKIMDDIPASTLFGMVDDVLARGLGQADTDLPVTDEIVHITYGACFDVTSYYVGAAAAAPQHKGLKSIEADGVKMLEKEHGIHTFLTQEPVVFNGVRLPKGALFQRSSDNKWAFLRLTPFAFDEAKDQMVFGSEISKTLRNERSGLMRMGGISMSGLVGYARAGGRISVEDTVEEPISWPGDGYL